MFGAFGQSCTQSSVTFVSQAGVEGDIGRKLGLNKPIVPVFGTRNLQKSDLPLNGYLPQIEVDPETYEVRADGELLTCEPAKSLPMAQRYFLF
jgi:urease subunit alpha